MRRQSSPPTYPGPGLGGHSIPINPFDLIWEARVYGLGTCFIEPPGKANTNMLHWLVSKIT